MDCGRSGGYGSEAYLQTCMGGGTDAMQSCGGKVLNPPHTSAGGIKLPPETDDYHWNTNTVVHILERREYTGCTVNFKTYTNSIWTRSSGKRSLEWFSTAPIRRLSSRKSLTRCRRSGSSVTAGRNRQEQPVFRHGYCADCGAKCGTAPPTTLSGRIILYVPTTEATREAVQRTLSGLLFWKIWSGCI